MSEGLMKEREGHKSRDKVRETGRDALDRKQIAIVKLEDTCGYYMCIFVLYFSMKI